MRILAIALLCAPLAAHDLYLVPERFVLNGSREIRVVMRNGPFPGSLVGPAVWRLRDTRALWEGGEAEMTGVKAGARTTVARVKLAQAGATILTTRTAPNTVTLEADHFNEHLEEEGHDAALAWRRAHGELARPGRERYEKFAKALVMNGRPNGFYRHVVGFEIEIVPEADPYTIRAGEELPVVVLFRGRPVEGVLVDTGRQWRGRVTRHAAGRTDSAGRIRVKLDGPGLWMLHAVKMERASGDADWQSWWASLTFERAE